MELFKRIHNNIEPSIDFNNNMNICYPHYLRYIDCKEGEPLSRLLCRDKYIDFKECKFKQKQNEFYAFYNNEFKKLKILSIPKYDDETDSFVDGNAPNSASSFFKDDEKMKKFFELKGNNKLYK